MSQLDIDIRGMEEVAGLPSRLLIPHYLIHSALYYRLDCSIITDHAYDQLARRIYDEWDNLDHRHKWLIVREGLLSGGHYIQFPNMVLGCAKMFKEHVEAQKPKSYISETEQAMALNARNKGQRGEREVIDLLQPHVDEVSAFNQLQSPILQRNTLQSDRGGYDIVGLPGFGIEVKRVESDAPGQLASWWAQTVRQAIADNVEPVLFFRMNGKKWKVRVFTRMPLPNGKNYKVPSVIDPDHFIFYMKAKLHCHQLTAKENS